MELPRLNGANVANEWQPISAVMWVGPISRCISLMALNTGRSGHPVQKFGGRAGMSPTAAMAAALCASKLLARAAITSASMPAGLLSARKHASRHVGAAQLDVDCLLDVVGTAFLDNEHGALSRAEVAQLRWHQRKRDV